MGWLNWEHPPKGSCLPGTPQGEMTQLGAPNSEVLPHWASPGLGGNQPGPPIPGSCPTMGAAAPPPPSTRWVPPPVDGSQAPEGLVHAVVEALEAAGAPEPQQVEPASGALARHRLEGTWHHPGDLLRDPPSPPRAQRPPPPTPQPAPRCHGSQSGSSPSQCCRRPHLSPRPRSTLGDVGDVTHP